MGCRECQLGRRRVLIPVLSTVSGPRFTFLGRGSDGHIGAAAYRGRIWPLDRRLRAGLRGCVQRYPRHSTQCRSEDDVWGPRDALCIGRRISGRSIT